ncbi:MAG: DUF1730 domain-containing protein [Bacteroidales bacterium]|nr:DUF1730 domain-containing protein [Bacteroidales bacterium]
MRSQALALGACACGFAKAEPVEDSARDFYSQWIAEGRNATMEYCERYRDVRSDPRLLLDGAQTIICCAFAYPASNGRIASYALGLDYHYVLKDKLNQLGKFIRERWGGDCRAVVDSAPMHERYWAVRSGIGFEGINNLIIVPGVGTYVFLAELLWAGSMPADEPCTLSCQGCMACIKACPGGALSIKTVDNPSSIEASDKSQHKKWYKANFDSRRCISYLTIEHRGELPEDTNLAGSIYGCDRCQRVCPHNRGNASVKILPEFLPREEIQSLSDNELLSMTPSHYKKLVEHSAMRRVPLPQLLRNLLHIKNQ